MPTKTSSAPVPPRLPKRATAWGCVLSNLVLPGLGTFAAGKRVAGLCQIVLSQTGFVLAMIWGVWFAVTFARTGELPPALGPYFWPAMVGLLLFFGAWGWALISSIQILHEARPHQ